MKKIFTITSICALSWQAHAGMMGDVTKDAASSRFTPFISGEAAATWHTIQASTVFGSSPSLSKQHWGGRGAVGLTRQYSLHWSASVEAGWGYYGHVTSNQSGSTTDGRASTSGTTNSDLYGFDLLAGILYQVNQYDLFFKAGAMAENRYYNGQVSTTITTNGVSSTNTLNLTNVQTNVFPEIKIGGIYHINNHVGVTLAYMGVFGNNSLNSQTSGTFPNGTTMTNLNLSASFQNPSLNSVMFGLTYQFT